MTASWLPDQDGAWHTPSELSLEELHPDFPRDETLAKRLGMRPTAGAEIAEYLEIEPGDLELLRRNPQLLKEFVETVRSSGADSSGGADEDERSDTEDGHAEGDPSIGFEEALEAAFNQIGEVELEDWVDNGRASDPARRAERALDATRSDRQSEPQQSDRWSIAARKRWEARDPVVREYLNQTYGGRCQICSATFPRRDGKPFFDAKYLVSPTIARWVDRPGNALSLCPTCLAKMLHGATEGSDVLDQIDQLASRAGELPDGGSVVFELCGEPVELTFAQRHLIDLGALLAAARESNANADTAA